MADGSLGAGTKDKGSAAKLKNAANVRYHGSRLS